MKEEKTKKSVSDMTFREYIGEEGVQHLKDRLEEVLDSKYGFILLRDTKTLTDCYKNVCGNCVREDVEKAVKDADRLKLLANCVS